VITDVPGVEVIGPARNRVTVVVVLKPHHRRAGAGAPACGSVAQPRHRRHVGAIVLSGPALGSAPPTASYGARRARPRLSEAAARCRSLPAAALFDLVTSEGSGPGEGPGRVRQAAGAFALGSKAGAVRRSASGGAASAAPGGSAGKRATAMYRRRFAVVSAVGDVVSRRCDIADRCAEGTPASGIRSLRGGRAHDPDVVATGTSPNQCKPSPSAHHGKVRYTRRIRHDSASRSRPQSGGRSVDRLR
jgi:hypothetical protein